MKCFEYLLKSKDTVAVLPTGFGKSLLFLLLADFVSVKAGTIYMCAYTTSTARDILIYICRFLFSHSTFRFTRVCEGHSILCSKKEF